MMVKCDKVGHVHPTRNMKSQEGFKGISEDLAQNRNWLHFGGQSQSVIDLLNK